MSTSIYECGDGVPSSIISDRTDSISRSKPLQPLSPNRASASKGASIAVAAVGQGFLAGVVALGGDPLIGAIASLMVLLCSLILALAEVGGNRSNR